MKNVNKPCLITGSSGFLGSHIMEAIDNVEGVQSGIDLSDTRFAANYINSENYGSVIHAAGKISGIIDNAARGPYFFGMNLKIATTVMDRFANFKGPFIYISSVCAYPGTENWPKSEEDLWGIPPDNTVLGYGMAKRMGVALCKMHYLTTGMQAIPLLLANLYGPRDRSSHVIPSIIKRFLTQKEVIIQGDPKTTREFLYVEDAARIIARAHQKAQDRFYGPDPVNINPGIESTVESLADALRGIVGNDVTFKFEGDYPQGNSRRSYDNSKARELGLIKDDFTPLKQGLQKTVEYFEKTKDDWA